MATHSSISAWEIPWTEEPGMRQTMGLQKVERGLASKEQRGCKSVLQQSSSIGGVVAAGKALLKIRQSKKSSS